MVSPSPHIIFPPHVKEISKESRSFSTSPSPSRFSFNSRSASRGRRRDGSIGSIDSSLDRSLSRSRLLGGRLGGVPVKDVERQEEMKYPELKEPKVEGKSFFQIENILPKLPSLLAHFLGYRPTPSRYSSPILPFLAYLSPQNETYLLSFLGAFVGILVVISLSYALSFSDYGAGSLPLTFASLGATAVLVFGAPDSPLSQPRNVFVGNFVSVFIGITISVLFQLSPHYSNQSSSSKLSFEGLVPVAAALAMALSLFFTQFFKSVHPPGGAIAMIAVIQPNAVQSRYALLLLIVLSAIGMIIVGCIFGNLGRRSYPKYWFSPHIPPKAPALIPPVELPMSSINNQPLVSTFSQTLDPPVNEGRVSLLDVDEGDEEDIEGEEGRGRSDARRRASKA